MVGDECAPGEGDRSREEKEGQWNKGKEELEQSNKKLGWDSNLALPVVGNPSHSLHTEGNLEANISRQPVTPRISILTGGTS